MNYSKHERKEGNFSINIEPCLKRTPFYFFFHIIDSTSGSNPFWGTDSDNSFSGSEVMASSLLSDLSACFSIVGVSLYIIAFSFQPYPASFLGVMTLFGLADTDFALE